MLLNLQHYFLSTVKDELAPIGALQGRAGSSAGLQGTAGKGSSSKTVPDHISLFITWVFSGHRIQDLRFNGQLLDLIGS